MINTAPRKKKVVDIIFFGRPDFGAKMAQMGLVLPLLVGVPESRNRIWIYDIKDRNLRLWMHCPHALRVLPLLVTVPRSGGRSLLYRGDYHRHLAGTPISCIFSYTPVYFTEFLFAACLPNAYSKNLAKMPIAHLLHLFIHACIFYNSSSNCLKPTHGVHFVITCIYKLLTSPTIWESVFVRE